MKPVIFFRHIDPDREEFIAAGKHFHVVTQRTLVPPGSLVIPRYSALPGYVELAEDVRILGGQLINTYEQHRFVADVRQYAPVLGDLTPKTWEHWYGLPQGAYVLKGVTNSRKNSWATRMFAPTVQDVPRIANSLLDDAEINEQGLVAREYVPLVQYGEGINGLPITNEWRFFVLHGQILAGGYYWANDPDLYPGDVNVPPAGAVAMVQQAIDRLGNRVPFYVVDVGERVEGGWVVIELNDGQQSGLPCLDVYDFYLQLAGKFKQ